MPRFKCVDPDLDEIFQQKCIQPMPKDPQADKDAADKKKQDAEKKNPLGPLAAMMGSMGMGDLMKGLGGNAETAALLKTSVGSKSSSSSSSMSSSSSFSSSSSSSMSSSSSSASKMSSASASMRG